MTDSVGRNFSEPRRCPFGHIGIVRFSFGTAVMLSVCLFGKVQAQNSPQPLTLEETVSLAVQNSGEVAVARARYATAESEVFVDRAVFEPNLYAGSNAAYTRGFPFITPQTPSLFNLRSTETLFNSPLRGQDKAAQEQAEKLRIELQRVRDDIAVRAASTYLELAAVQESLRLAQNEESSGDKVLSIVRERSLAGYELPIEITRAQLELAKVEERIVRLRARGDVLHAQLQMLIGYALDKQLEIDSEELRRFEMPQEMHLISTALDSNLVIEQAVHERNARAFILKGEKGAYWPSVDIVGQYDLLSEINNWDQFFQPNSIPNNNVVVGISARIPILDLTIPARVALAKSRLQEAELVLANQRQNLSLDVKQRIQRIRELEATLDVRKLELKLASEVLATNQARATEGGGLPGEVERARLDEGERQEALLDATFEIAKEQLLLLEVTGELPEVFPSLTGEQFKSRDR
jgi:outer membrane protein TolC